MISEQVRYLDDLRENYRIEFSNGANKWNDHSIRIVEQLSKQLFLTASFILPAYSFVISSLFPDLKFTLGYILLIIIAIISLIASLIFGVLELNYISKFYDDGARDTQTKSNYFSEPYINLTLINAIKKFNTSGKNIIALNKAIAERHKKKSTLSKNADVLDIIDNLDFISDSKKWIYLQEIFLLIAVLSVFTLFTLKIFSLLK